MKTYLKFLVIIPFLIACGNGEPTVGGEQKEFITDSAPAADSTMVPGVSDETRQGLSDYFSEKVIQEIDQFLMHYNAALTDTDFEKAYLEGKALLGVMYDDLANPQTSYLRELAVKQEYWSPVEILDELQEFNGQLGPIEISCVAECSELDFVFDLQAMLEKSKQTTGSGDEDFLTLLISIDGDYGYAGYNGFKSWFNQTWDYGGSSLVGDGTLLACVKNYMEYKKKYVLFQSELQLIHEDFVDALQNGSSYNYAQQKILKEYDQVLNLKIFTPEEEKGIREHYKAIQKGGEPFQFECETADCTYG